VVHACGSPSSTRSHFDAQDYMESGTPDLKSTRDGWLSRGLVATPMTTSSPFRAVAIGARLPRILRGEVGAVTMSGVGDFDIKSCPAPLAVMADARGGFESMYEQGARDLLHGTGKETFEAVKILKAANPARNAPANGARYPSGRFGEHMKQIAELIK